MSYLTDFYYLSMKIRSVLLTLVVGFLTTFAFAAEQAALSEELAATVRAAAQSGDNRAVAQAAADNPALAAQIASVAAAANPGSASLIAAAVAAIVPSQAAQIAAAVTVVVPTQAANIAASVVTVVPSQAAQVAASVSAAAPSQAGAITAAVTATVPAQSAEVIQAVATSTNSSVETVRTASTTQENVAAGNAAAAHGATDAQTAVQIVTTITPTPPSIPATFNEVDNGNPQTSIDPTISVSAAGGT